MISNTDPHGARNSTTQRDASSSAEKTDVPRACACAYPRIACAYPRIGVGCAP